MALRSVASGSGCFVRRIYPPASTSSVILPHTSAKAESTNLFEFARVITRRVSGCTTLEDAGINNKTKGGFLGVKSTDTNMLSSVSMVSRSHQPRLFIHAKMLPLFSSRSFSTVENLVESSASTVEAPRIKFKRLDKTSRHIMQILDKEAVEEVKMQREIPDIRPGYIVQIKVEVPENKRRVSTLKGIVIARRNSGLSSTFRIRRMVAGVGVESVFPMYSPNIKEIKVLEKKKVRRAKLYYLRDKMNALKK